MVCGGTNYEGQIVQVRVPFRNRMGRWNDREGGLACRQDIRQEIGNPQAGAARSEEDVLASATRPAENWEQIQFLLGHVSVQTTERYLGCKQKFREAVNDRLGIEPTK